MAFGRALRESGIDVTAADSINYARALNAVGLADRNHVYWAGRATLVRDPQDIDVYDRTFGELFDGGPPAPTTAESAVDLIVAYDTPPDGHEHDAPSSGEDPVSGTPVVTVRWSRAETLRHRDFASLSGEELDEARTLMADIRFAGAARRSRRRHETRARRRPDLRGTVRTALRHGGEPIRRSYTAPTRRARRLVLLCDVSGSMEPYTRALLRFVHAIVVARRSVEVFTVGTRLTRITPALTSRDPDAALRAAATQVPDLGGGTRLGEGLRSFNDQWGTRGTARGAIVVVVSDGWDRGDPDLLGSEMARLRRIAHRVVWVNPLKAGEGYAPLARGMAAALPSVDDFVEGHSLAALEDLVRVIERTGT